MGWVDEDISEDKLSRIQNGTIWGITVIATISVISGLNAGIKFLSLLAFFLGMLLLFLVFVMDNTKFLMNLIVQEVGYFCQWNFFELNFWTDAFAQLRPGEGRAVDGLAGSTTWMDGWMVFYQAWWYVQFVYSFVHSLAHSFLTYPCRLSKGFLVCLCWSLCCPHFSRAHCGRSNPLLACCAHPVLYHLVFHLGRDRIEAISTGR